MKPVQIGLISFKNMGKRQWAMTEDMTPKNCKELIKRENSKQENALLESSAIHWLKLNWTNWKVDFVSSDKNNWKWTWYSLDEINV